MLSNAQVALLAAAHVRSSQEFAANDYEVKRVADEFLTWLDSHTVDETD